MRWPGAGRKEAIPISDIYHLIDRLERLLNESWQVPLSQFIVVNEDDYLDVVDQMRTAVPQQIKDAERIQQERDRIIAHAQEEAERIVQLAQEEAAKAAENHEILQKANTKAQAIVERAQHEASALKSEADDYAKDVLKALDERLVTLEGEIADLMTVVRNGLKTLMKGPQRPLDENPGGLEGPEDPIDDR